ncbi:ferric reductase family protein CYBJADRAFT_167960 [Cyberlindnera jadinii NRRL Y-1542]|uniref:ferric-chelate reductase (NADPH) n=1 Tax=Cyberlindnera jadinii (strain ATCC 18201 / CBS 1600 / BCRC 20928 / JCM 3617 / NBRC 0987 / NRRL Y-1542) TaxID=983966 RepID=A0A1E4S1M7_CYBJN|nr:hypothetical protein CYBJADRAFT_167960 [Cyberlindnera jadinii NRRL Y-1542]ODV73399.1 hypothetical protein CYBJADRAFT_167960 [Cyberlindnera jadinii NRRL Y-1542]
MATHKNPFVGEDPFKKDRDLIYLHIGFTKKITWGYQYFMVAVLLALLVTSVLNKWLRRPNHNHKPHHWIQRLWHRQPTLPFLRNQFSSNGVFFNITIFYVINTFVLFYKLPWNDQFNFALRAGLVSSSNIPLLYLIPLKSGPLLHLFEVSYETIIIYHKWVGILVVMTAVLHGLAFFLMLTWDYCLSSPKMLTGYFCLFVFLAISVSSVKFMRTRFYEMFYYIHLCSFILFLPVFFKHHYVCKTFVVIVAGFLVYDRLIRYIWYLWCLNCTVKVTRNSKYMVVSIDPRSSSLSKTQRVIAKLLLKNKKDFRWRPSNHLFITIPSISAFQSHPFTIASLPSDESCQLIIKVHNGFTRKLCERVQHGEQSFTCFINGPYGTSNSQLPTDESILGQVQDSAVHESSPLIKKVLYTTVERTSNSLSSIESFNPKEKIILVSGGVGISLTLPLLKHYENSEDFETSLIWITRSEELIPLIDLDITKSNITVWNSTEKGPADLEQLLYDYMEETYQTVHIIGCGPSSLMSSLRSFAVEKMKTNRVNMVLEEFSF